MVFNVHRGRTYGNLNKEERVKDLYGGMVFYLKVVKKKKKKVPSIHIIKPRATTKKIHETVKHSVDTLKRKTKFVCN